MKLHKILGVAVLASIVGLSQAAPRPGSGGGYNPGHNPGHNPGRNPGNPGYPQPQPQPYPQPTPGYGEVKELQLPFYQQEFSGENTIVLRQKVQELYGFGSYCNQRLLNITLIAKSRQGYGEAGLLVGNTLNQMLNVPGRPEQYYNYGGFYTIDLPIQRGIILCSGEGAISVVLRGNIKVDQIILRVRNDQQQPQPYPIPYPQPQPQPIEQCGASYLQLGQALPWDFNRGNNLGCVPPNKSTACVYNRVQECRNSYNGSVTVRVVQSNAYVYCDHTPRHCQPTLNDRY